MAVSTHITPGEGAGWTTFAPPDHEVLVHKLSYEMRQFAEDCRDFAKVARLAQFDDLPAKFGLSWEAFCEQQLHQSAEFVEAVIKGVEVLGEEMPIPLEVAHRVGKQLVAVAHPKEGRRNKLDESSSLSQQDRAKRNGIGLEKQKKLDYLAGHNPELLDKVQNGTMSAHEAYQLAKGQGSTQITFATAPSKTARAIFAKMGYAYTKALIAELQDVLTPPVEVVDMDTHTGVGVLVLQETPPNDLSKFVVTGGICKHGHEYEDSGHSLRYRTNHQCVQCNKRYDHAYKKARKVEQHPSDGASPRT